MNAHTGNIVEAPIKGTALIVSLNYRVCFFCIETLFLTQINCGVYDFLMKNIVMSLDIGCFFYFNKFL